MLTGATVERFDAVALTHGELLPFVAFLIPGHPDDVLCFLAGLTAIPVRRFVLLVVVTRRPAHLLVSLAGDGVATGRLELAFVLLGLLTVLAVAGYRYGGRLLDGSNRPTGRG